MNRFLLHRSEQSMMLNNNFTPTPLSISNCCLHFGAHTSRCFFFFKYFIYLFLYRGEGRDKERERNINVWLPLMWPPLGTWPATQACALTGNWTSGSLVHSPHSIHWATPARARCFLMYYINVIYDYFFTYTACLYYTFLCDFLFSLKVHFKDIFIKSMHREQTFLKNYHVVFHIWGRTQKYPKNIL